MEDSGVLPEVAPSRPAADAALWGECVRKCVCVCVCMCVCVCVYVCVCV